MLLPFPFDTAISFAVWLLSMSFCVRWTPRLGHLGCNASVASVPLPVSLLLSLELPEEEEEEESIPTEEALSGRGAGAFKNEAGGEEEEGCCA